MVLVKKNKGYTFRIKPNAEQVEYFSKAFGCSRKIYNIYVDLLFSELESQGYINGFIKDFKFPTPAKYKKEFEYLKEVDSLALANVQLNFGKAVSKFNKESDKKSYKKSAIKKNKTVGKIITFKDLKGMPSFKSKKDEKQSFTTNNQSGTINIDGDYVKIPKLKSKIKVIFHRKIPDDCTIKSATISKDFGGNYEISFNVEYHIEEKKITPETFVGLDYSQNNFFVSSDGEIANYPHYYKILEKRLKKEQRKITRMVPKSNNWCKQKLKIFKLNNKAAKQRKDWIHKKSFELSNKYDAICVEDIDLRNLAQCLSLGKNVHDNGFGMFRNFLKYKLEDRGKFFIKIDRWYPSSKTCNDCGYINSELKLSDREWVCPICRTVHNRDCNAAKNIKAEGIKVLLLA